MMGSAGSGKSYNVAQDFIARLSDPNFAGANLMVVRKTEASNRNSTFSELCSAVMRVFGDMWEKFWKITSEPMTMTSLVTGNKIIFRGMSDMRQREKIKSVSFTSGKLTWIWCEEATEFSESDVDVLDDRLRGDLSFNPNLYYQITLTFNPVDASHWIKSRFFDFTGDTSDIITHRSTYLDNAFIDASYHRRMMMRAQTDPEGYRVYGLGEWGCTEGLILSGFEVGDLSKSRESYDFLSMGQDFGFNHANAILLLGHKDGAIYVLRELYLKELDTAAIIEAADKAGFPRDVAMYCDSAEPDRIRTWKNAGYRAEAVKKGSGSVTAQIDYLKSHPLKIDRSCVNLISELGAWRWKVDDISGKFTDIPNPSPDDAIAALRYGIEPVRKKSKLRTFSKQKLGL